MNLYSIIFLGVLLALSIVIFYMNRKRNAWDILFFNSTLAILGLFMVGILADNIGVWKYIATGLIIIATGEKIVGLLVKEEKEE